MRTIIEILIILFFIISEAALTFLPIILSYLYDNWWLMFIYFVVGIPMVIIWGITSFILNFLDWSRY